MLSLGVYCLVFTCFSNFTIIHILGGTHRVMMTPTVSILFIVWCVYRLPLDHQASTYLVEIFTVFITHDIAFSVAVYQLLLAYFYL